MKSISIPSVVALLSMVLTGCGESGPDYTPIGDGLKAIGISLVVFGVVGALADLIRSGEKPPDEPNQPRPRRTRGKRPKGGGA